MRAKLGIALLTLSAVLALATSFSLLFGHPLLAAMLTGGLTSTLAAAIGLLATSSDPLSGDIRALRTVALQLGRGEFHSVAVRSPTLQPVADGFNEMAEQLRRLVTSREELLRAVSHELRTPVARLGFAIELLADQADPDDRARRAEAIQDDISELETDR